MLPPLDPPERRQCLGALTGWWVLGLCNVVAVSLWLDTPGGGIGVRLGHHAIDMGRHLAAGLVAFALCNLCNRISEWPCRVAPRWLSRWFALGALTCLSLGISALLLAPDLQGIANRNSEALDVPPGPLHAALVVGGALSIPLAAIPGPWFTSGWRRLLPLPVVAALYWLNATISPHDNPGFHFYLSWLCATLLGAACTWPDRWLARWARLAPMLRRGFVIALGVWSCASVAFTPSHSLRIDLAQWHANLLPQYWAHWSEGKQRDSTRFTQGNLFFSSRAELPPIAPRAHELLAPDGVVVVLSVDALRSDVVKKANAKYLPHIFELQKTGTTFLNARVPGSATVTTLSSMSTGRYFSQLYWTKEKQRDHWLVDDDSVHFPQLLSAAGVRTVQSRSAAWMSNNRGVLRGFDASVFKKGTWKWTSGAELANRLIALLEANPSGPVFAYAHFLDTHTPYWPGRKKSNDPFQQYLHAIQYVDAQIGRVLDALERLGMQERALIVITADHGEAFGEHRTTGHATTLYEEQLRIPLIFHGPTVPQQRRKEQVSLIDLGPTLLELYRQAVPASFMGESLVPLLQGKDMKFSRPIVAEARTLQSLVFDDGIKVIRDRKTEVVEIYDLKKDPKELRNLSDAMNEDLEARLATLVHFFEVHTNQTPGYEVPLRK